MAVANSIKNGTYNSDIFKTNRDVTYNMMVASLSLSLKRQRQNYGTIDFFSSTLQTTTTCTAAS